MCDGLMEVFKKTGDPAKDTENAQKIILASSALKGVGEIAQGVQARRYFKYQQDQANADAAAEAELGQVRGDKIRKAGKIVQGDARAAYGASGVRADTGSAAVVQQQINRDVEEDALTELYTGQRRARVKQAEAQGFGSQASNALSAGISGAGKSLLGGAATATEAGERTSRWIKKYNKED